MRIYFLLSIALASFCGNPNAALGQSGLLDLDPVAADLSSLADVHKKLTTYTFVAKGFIVRQKQDLIRTNETIIIRSVRNGKEQLLANSSSGVNTFYWLLRLNDQSEVRYKSGSLKHLEEKNIDDVSSFPIKTFDPILQSLSHTANFVNKGSLPADKFKGILGEERLEDVVLGTDENIATWANKQSKGDIYFQETVFSKAQRNRPVQTVISRRQQGKIQVRSRVATEWGDFDGRYLPKSISGVYYPINPVDTETQFDFEIDWRFNELRFDSVSATWIEPIEESFGYLFP